MNEFINCNSDFAENQKLSNYELELYDIDRSLFNVVEIMDDFRDLRMKFLTGPQIKMTSRYKLIWVQESVNSSSYNKVDKYIDDKDRYLEICNILTALSNLELTKEENVVLQYYFLTRTSLYKAKKELGVCTCTIEGIKDSCVIKIARAFNIEIMKGDHLPNDKEDKFANFAYI